MDDGSFVNPDVPAVVDDDNDAALFVLLLLESNDPGPNGPDVVLPPLDFVRSAGLSGNVSVLLFSFFYISCACGWRTGVREMYVWIRSK